MYSEKLNKIPMTKHWRSLEEKNNPEIFKKEEALAELEHKRSVIRGKEGTSRRDFLKAFGFTVAGTAVLASCKKPVEKAIPYLVKPEEVIPGTANYYASTYFEGNEYCSVLVKVRDGRPIKIEGNNLSPVSRKGTSARVQASVLDLYDDARYKGPLKKGEPVAWETADREIVASLQQMRTENRKVAFLTSTVISPSANMAISRFQTAYPNVQHVVYDAIPASGILMANRESFGMAAIPDLRFDLAEVIVSFGADFLGTWLSPVEYTVRYAEGRDLKRGKRMSRHYQVEAAMSLTGSNADVRIPVKPSQELPALKALLGLLRAAAGESTPDQAGQFPELKPVAEDLWNHRSRSMVVSGSNSKENQLIVNAINHLLGNIGKTVSFDRCLLTRQSTDEITGTFVQELLNGGFAGIIVAGANPVYDHPLGERLGEALKKLSLSISFSDRPDETSACCGWTCPMPHYLESWGDAQPKTGSFSLQQPAIRKLFDSRQYEESLLKWAGEEITAYDFIRGYWEKQLFPVQSIFSDFRSFWNDCLQKGFFETEAPVAPVTYSDTGIPSAMDDTSSPIGEWEVILYESVAMGNGKSANNPWLQELPDPVAKISWDNFASVPVSWATDNQVANGDVITIGGLELPVFVQPGQADQTIAVALGYGRKMAGKSGDGVGSNAYPLVDIKKGFRQYFAASGSPVKTAKKYPLALSQTHHSMEGRPIIREATYAEWLENPAAGNEIRKDHIKHATTLYDKPEFPGHHWGLAVDLNACTGCANCTISCQAENNIPVVGREQVQKRRIMHWIRIDRYFSGNEENPSVLFQPVMCQHCDNAPCENVCPVAATPHSDEGLNQMAYNRCVGTRYCLNNCPYRVRRFNWLQFVNNDKFDYAANSDLGRMVLNPDVTVRSRGVVEKCTFCVQRIQEKKQNAKIEQRPLADGEIEPACVQSCPASALVFGDMNDRESKIFRLIGKSSDPDIPGDPRNYHLLEELHTLPSVGYLTKIRNTGTNA